jgi:hypothetical protein
MHRAIAVGCLLRELRDPDTQLVSAGDDDGGGRRKEHDAINQRKKA